MGKKKLFSPGQDIYCEGSPLLINTVRRLGGKNNIQLTVSPVTARLIKEADVCIHIDDTDETLHETIHDTEDCIAAGTTVTFRLPDESEQYTPGVAHVVYEDGTEWTCSGSWTPLTSKVLLEDALGSNDVADEFRAQFGTDCRYFPQEERGLWTCTCGTSNLLAEERCMKCRRKYSGFKTLNINALKDQSARHAEISSAAGHSGTGKEKSGPDLEEKLEQLEERREQRRQERLQARQEKAAARAEQAAIKGKGEKKAASDSPDVEQTAGQKKKFRSVLPFVLIPVILVAVVLLATIPGFLKNKANYKEATEYLANAQFDEAEKAFQALGTYSDSQEQLEKNIPYEKAMYLIRCADNGDSTALALLGLDKNSFENSDEIRIALYNGASELLQTLDGYKDSAEQSEKARATIDEIKISRRQESYEAAAALLEQGCYNKAKAAFLELGDYNDSAAMASECDYQKACELLTFCEKYDVRGIYARLSESSDANNLFSLNDDAALRIGTDGVTDIYSLLTADGTDVIVEDAPTAENMVPFCDAAATLFESIRDYKDSAELEQRVKDAGDFTKPFYDLCASGDLNGAIEWLDTYDGDFENRDDWLSLLTQYQSMAIDWSFVSGDPTVVPLTYGYEENAYSLTSQILIADDTVTLRLYFNDAGDYVDLYAAPGDTNFALYGDYSYFSSLNNSGNLTYVKYGESGMLSSSEYRPA